MNTIQATPQPAAQAIQRHQQRFLSTDQALQYIKDVYGITVAKATLYKKRSVEKGAFIGQRSPFGKLVFSPAEIDLYLATGGARGAVETDGGQA